MARTRTRTGRITAGTAGSAVPGGSGRKLTRRTLGAGRAAAAVAAGTALADRARIPADTAGPTDTTGGRLTAGTTGTAVAPDPGRTALAATPTHAVGTVAITGSLMPAADTAGTTDTPDTPSTPSATGTTDAADTAGRGTRQILN